MNRKIRSIVIFCMLCVAICGCRKDDAAIAVQGLKMDSQRTLSLSDKPVRLSVQTVPEKVTEHYTLVWESSDPEVVRIEPDGTAIPGKKGSASVCCYLAERPSALQGISPPAAVKQQAAAAAASHRFHRFILIHHPPVLP